jgi:hypothetical protein
MATGKKRSRASSARSPPTSFTIPHLALHTVRHDISATPNLASRGADLYLKDGNNYENIILKNRRGWAPWLGGVIGHGGYGIVFGTVSERRMLEDLRNRMKRVIFDTFPGRADPVVVKVQPTNTRTAVVENTLHMKLARARCVKLPNLRELCSKEYVPRFYFGGQVRNMYSRSQRQLMHVTVMGRAPGVSVDTLLEDSAMTAKLYLMIERALCSLWVNGVFHTDAHQANIMYDQMSKKLTVIDFGRGVLAPDNLVKKVRVAIAEGVASGVRSLGEVWRPALESGAGVQNYTNRVMRERGETDYLPDGYILAQLYNLLSKDERHRVPSARKALWGYSQH